MTLIDDIKAYEDRIDNIKKDSERANAELIKIQKKILKGETTGSNLADFCIIHPGNDKLYQKIDGELKKSRNGLVLTIEPESVQTSCSISHGTFETRYNYVIGTQESHNWDLKKGELVVNGKFAEKKCRSRLGEYELLGKELTIPGWQLPRTPYSVLGFANANQFLIGDEVTDAIANGHLRSIEFRYGLKDALKLIGYEPDAKLEKRIG